MSLPINTIILFWGDVGDIPSGWQICDGTNGTPNLVGKFVYTASSDSVVNSSTGSATMFHSHTSSASGTSSDNSHSHTVSGTSGNGTNPSTSNLLGYGDMAVSISNHNHTVSGTSQSFAAHYHLVYETPTSGSIPYVDVYYMMRIT